MATEVATPNGNTPAEKDEGFRASFMKMESQFELALPPHMPPDRFMRVVLTAVNGNPDLLKADRASLFEAAMKAAQDGLLPDGREGALVIYNTKLPKKNDDQADQWIKKVQWMPMIQGILKKVRNSGELLTITAHVVYTNDVFKYVLGDDERIDHEPTLEERGTPRLVYAIAKTKDGGVYREIMTLKDVEKVRAVSKAKDGPAWKNWWDEMSKKVVLRRLSKRLPTSSDLDDLLRRDDDLYDFSGKRADGTPALGEPVKHPLRDSAHARLDHRPGQTIDATANREEPDRVLAGDEDQGGRGQEQVRDDQISTGRQDAGEAQEGGSASGAGKPGPTKNNAQAPMTVNGSPYANADDYMNYMRDEFDKATSEAAVNDLWGGTRRDRQELLEQTQLVELETDKKAKIAGLRLRKGGAT
jgi:phage RecT family recombinase